MRSAYPKKLVRQELDKISDELYRQFARDIGYQTIATVLWVLHKHFGFGKSRMQRVKDLTEDEFKLMEDGILGRDYSTSDVKKWLDSVGIDLDVSQYHE